MKKISKIISLLMAAVIALSVFAVSASAVATELAAGSTRATATKIPSFGTEYVSSLSKAGEQDWFKFTTLSDDAYYTIALENYNINSGSNSTQQVNLFVYDTYLKEISFLSDTSSTNIKLEKNTTYYIKVTMGYNRPEYTGNYEILLTYILDPVSNNMSEATAININRSYDYSLDGTGDIDWYKFDAPISGTYKMSLVNKNIQEGWNDTQYLQMHLMDEYQKTISTCYSTSSAEVTLEKGHTYYIKIVMGHNRSYWIGNYGFSVTCDSVSAKTLSKISVASMPNKTTYNVGESFDKTGLAIKAHYSDGTTAKVTSYTVSGFSSTTAGTKTITVKYTEGGVTKSCTFTVKVTAASSTVDLTVALSSITIEKGGSLTVDCLLEGVDGNYTINFKVADDSIAKCAWGEVASDRVPLLIFGEDVGTTTVTVSIINRNTEKVLDTEKITVTVVDPDSVKPKLTLSDYEVTIDEDEYVDVYVWWDDYSGNTALKFSFEDVTVAKGEWLEDELDLVQKKAPLRIYGEGEGKQTLTITLYDKDTGEIFDKAYIEVEVNDDSGSSENTGYSFFEWIIIIVFFGWIWYI